MRLITVVAAAALAQASPPQPAPTFRAGVEVARLDVRVSDADGRPLKDLRPEEVEVVENGTPRPIVLFQHVEEPLESLSEIASRTVAGEVSTNQGAARGHLYVIVFDQLHIAPGNEQRARLAAQRFVRTRLRPGDRVVLYALPGPGPQINFTADARRVATALAEMHGTAEAQAMGAIATMSRHEAFEIVRGNELLLQRVADRVQGQSGSDTRRSDPSAFAPGTIPLTELVREDARKIANTADGEARVVLARFSDLLRPLADIEGRKSILLISEGFDGDRLTREIEDVAAAAAASYSVVYAFDVNRREVDVSVNEPAGADQAAAIHDRLSPLGSLAAETGGALLVDAAARADEAFASVSEQSQDYYVIGFTPRDGAPADRGAYRRVTVRVRRGGARVSTRTGFALTDASARLDRRQAIDRALAAPFPQQGLPLSYTTYVLRGSAPRIQNVIVSLSVQLPIVSAEERRAADVVFVVRAAADGRVAASGHDTIPLPARAEGDATTGTGAFRVQFELPAGDYLMRAVVREPGGLVGTADRRFTVRPLDGPGVEAGDLIIGGSRDELPVRPTAYSADGLSGVLELTARTQEQLRDARVVVDLMPVGETSATVSSAASLGEVRTTDRGVTREARIDLPLPSVLPGSYVARARVVVGADTVSQAVRELDVRAGRRPDAAEAASTAAPTAFDPREVARGAVAREFEARLALSSSIAASEAHRGVERLSAADYSAAAAAFTAVLDSEPRNAAAAFLLGWSLHGAGQDRLAIGAWRRAAYIDPTFVPAHLALADLYVQIAQPALAAQALRAGLTARPESPELLDRLSRLETRQK